MRVAAIFSQFPRYDETFLLRETKALADGGVRFDILSLRRCQDAIVHEDAKPLLACTTYLPWVLSVEVLCACGYWLRKRPRAVMGAMGFALRGLVRWPLATIKNLLILPKTLAFARRLAMDPPDLVYGLWASYPASAAKLVAELLDRPWCFAAHAHDIYADNALLADKVACADRVLTCTEVNREHLVKLVPAREANILCVHHGLDMEAFKPRDDERPARPLRVLAVGSLFVCKGYPALFEALAVLRRLGVEAELRIVGDGPERPDLEERVRVLGLETCVAFAGYATQEAMPAHYQWADVFVLMAVPEIHWGIPNVVLESMACGVPVIVTGLPSLRRVFAPEAVGAFLPLTSDAERVVAAVKALQELAHDPEKRRRIAAAARAVVEAKFERQACAAQIQACWQALLQEHAGGSA